MCLIFINFFLDFDECASQPCNNEGVCEDTLDAYVCHCQPGYTGTQCQTGLYFFIAFLSVETINFSVQNVIESKQLRVFLNQQNKRIRFV